MLRAMGQRAPLSLITRALDDEDDCISRAALTAMGPSSNWPEIGDRLLHLLFHGADETRAEVVRTLARIAPADAKRRLLEIVKDSGSEHLHWICIEALVAMRAAGQGSTGRAEWHS